MVQKKKQYRKIYKRIFQDKNGRYFIHNKKKVYIEKSQEGPDYKKTKFYYSPKKIFEQQKRMNQNYMPILQQRDLMYQELQNAIRDRAARYYDIKNQKLDYMAKQLEVQQQNMPPEKREEIQNQIKQLQSKMLENQQKKENLKLDEGYMSKQKFDQMSIFSKMKQSDTESLEKPPQKKIKKFIQEEESKSPSLQSPESSKLSGLRSKRLINKQDLNIEKQKQIIADSIQDVLSKKTTAGSDKNQLLKNMLQKHQDEDFYITWRDRKQKEASELIQEDIQPYLNELMSKSKTVKPGQSKKEVTSLKTEIPLIAQKYNEIFPKNEEDEINGQEIKHSVKIQDLKKCVKKITDLRGYGLQILFQGEIPFIKKQQQKVFLIVRENHVTVIIAHDHCVELFDPQANEKRQIQDKKLAHIIAVKYSPDSYCKFKMNSNKVQDGETGCWFYVYRFIQNRLVNGQSFKKATDFDKDKDICFLFQSSL